MRVLVLSKRQYMSKDLLDDRYGRFYDLPQELARRGHQVTGVCLSYRLRTEGHVAGPGINKTLVDWYSVNIGRVIVPGIITYLKLLKKICDNFKPDILVACSDAFHVISAYRLAGKFCIPCVADLYDNFESYPLTRIPGILPLFKRSVKNVSAVICISSGLKYFIEEHYRPRGRVNVLSNGVPEGHFRPLDRRQCRRDLGLPVDAKVIGTAGALASSRGIEVLFQAARELIGKDSSVHLVVAGPLESQTTLPEYTNIHYLGKLEYDKVPILFNALDVGIICNRESSFGRYCFPQKAFEMLACRLPVVAADVGAMSELFVDHPECLYPPENKQALVCKVREQLVRPTSCFPKVPTWSSLAEELESLLQSCVLKVK